MIYNYALIFDVISGHVLPFCISSQTFSIFLPTQANNKPGNDHVFSKRDLFKINYE